MISRTLAMVAVLVLAAIVGCGGQPKVQNLVIITIDTIRADHLGTYGYFRDLSPNLDAFADQSVVFENCYAPMATTLPTHLSLMTSTYPIEHGVFANVGDGGARFVPSPVLRTVAEIAGSDGRATGAFVSATPIKSHSGIATGFEHFDEPQGAQRTASQTNQRVFRWLGGVVDRPFLLWVHYFDPHAPYEAPPPYGDKLGNDPGLERYRDERDFASSMTQFDGREFPGDHVINRYDEEIAFTDAEFGRLLEKLGERPDWDRTVVVVVGDHGEGLGQHDEWHHGLGWREQLHVPLFMRIPGIAPRREETMISVVDVIPTLFGFAPELPLEPLLSQASGRDALGRTGDRYLLSLSSSKRRSANQPFGLFALTGARWKYIRRGYGEDALYDLANDPHELANVIEQYPDTVATLEERLDVLIEKQLATAQVLWGGREGDTDTLDFKTRSELEALGYVD